MFNIDIHGIKNASEKEKEKFREAIFLLKVELNKPDFWVEFKDVYRICEEVDGDTFSEFQDKFLSGSDKFNKESDGDLDVYVSYYYSRRSVVGYTYPTTYKTWVNRKFFDRYNLAEIAGNVAHEYLHNLGYGHKDANKDSLTYVFGYFVRARVAIVIDIIETIQSPNTYTPWYKRLLRKIKRIF